MKLNAGDILLFKAETGLSKLIAWGTNSVYSHVAVCVEGDEGRIIDSMPGGGVKMRNVVDIQQKFEVFRIQEHYSYECKGVIEFLLKNLDSKYDYFGVMWLGVLKVLSKTGLPLKSRANRWQKDRDYFCSELCYEAFYTGGGLDIVPQVTASDITSPGDIAESPVTEMLPASTAQAWN